MEKKLGLIYSHIVLPNSIEIKKKLFHLLPEYSSCSHSMAGYFVFLISHGLYCADSAICYLAKMLCALRGPNRIAKCVVFHIFCVCRLLGNVLCIIRRIKIEQRMATELYNSESCVPGVITFIL